MPKQYLRKISLVVGSPGGQALDLSDLQFKFQVRRGDFQTPNSATIRVYNLSDQTVKKLQTKEFSQLVLQAGYEGNYGTIFNGTIKYKYKGHESAIDSYLDLVAADGDSAYNFAVINTSLAAGSKPEDHLSAISSAMETYGVTKDDTQPPLSTNTLPRGKVMYGMARDYARVLAQSNGSTWSIQDSKLQLILQTSYRPGDPIVLTSASGLIGFPEQTQNGIRIKTLLNPSIKIGTRVQIDNASVQLFHFDLSIPGQVTNTLVPKLDDDGMYKVLVSEHSGDTRGNPFYTDLVCIGVNASIPAGSPLIFKQAVAPYA
jgi:hypothetical protein